MKRKTDDESSNSIKFSEESTDNELIGSWVWWKVKREKGIDENSNSIKFDDKIQQPMIAQTWWNLMRKIRKWWWDLELDEI